MSAAEDDTELRDLLLQNLENSGVLNKLKAQMRAAVFLAMEEQDRIENKAPLVNENLKKCLNTKDGRVVAGLVLDFLQVFDLDFTLAVFEPEINVQKPLETREALCKELGLDLNPKSPILLELVQRRHKQQSKDQSWKQTKDQEPSELQTVRGKFDFYDKVMEPADGELTEDRLSPPLKVSQRGANEDQDLELDSVIKLDSVLKPISGLKPDSVLKLDSSLKQDSRLKLDSGIQRDTDPQRDLDLDDIDDGDSFFDDPLPQPQKTYGCSEDFSPALVLRRDKSLSEKPTSPVPSLSLGRSSSSEPSRTGAAKTKDKEPKDKPQSDRSGSHRLDEDVEYDDDFNSHRSDLSRSEVSIGEEIEEVSIEGPEPSDKFDETTQDLSVSQLSHTADYMEDVP